MTERGVGKFGSASIAAPCAPGVAAMPRQPPGREAGAGGPATDPLRGGGALARLALRANGSPCPRGTGDRQRGGGGQGTVSRGGYTAVAGQPRKSPFFVSRKSCFRFRTEKAKTMQITDPRTSRAEIQTRQAAHSAPPDDRRSDEERLARPGVRHLLDRAVAGLLGDREGGK